ncbi:MAG: FAD-dependent oxidoreductase [Oscillospiraceae bacterium]|nr:FAD-dependent oxidoreductase [Oscillospiraceae bacterium]
MPNLSRRDFLKGSLATAAAAVIGGNFAADTPIASAEAASSAAEQISTVPSVLNPQDYAIDECSISDFSQTEFFKSWNFGPLEIKGRLVKSAAGSNYLPGVSVEEVVDEYSTFTKNSIGLVWVEDFVNLYSKYPALYKVLTRENCEEYLNGITEAVHAAGGYVGYQLSQMGAQYSGFNPAEHEQFAGAEAQDLNQDEISAVIEEFADSALYLKEHGFDAVEINAAGNNICQAFLSRNRNKRTDEYGPDSPENRARFVVEMITKIHEKCGKDFPIQVLINGIEEMDKNIGQNFQMTTVEENKAICKILEDAGAASLHVRIGPCGQHVAEFAADMYFTGYGIDGTTGYGTQFDFSRHFQGKLRANHGGYGLMLDVAKEIKSAVSIPVGTVCCLDPARFPDYFEQALEDGCCDFMLLTRPLQADPEYAQKLKENRRDEIRPCTRCMHCHFDYDEQGNFYEHCRVNAAHMRAHKEAMPEGRIPLKAETPKKVMVIGGGPGGMEAARIAAECGHDVTLYEKNSYLGGLLIFANAIKGPHENLDNLRKYLIRQQEVQGVKVVMSTEVTTNLIKSEAPDIVILAAGGKRDSLGLASSNGTNVVPMDDLMRAQIGENVVIVGGNAQAVDTAMYLLAQGKKVQIVTPESASMLGKGHSAWVKTFEMPAIYAKGLRVWENAAVKEVGDGNVVIDGGYGVDQTVVCDTVIEAMDMLPNTSLIDGLSDVETYAVGDCSHPFNIAEAINKANLIARYL